MRDRILALTADRGADVVLDLVGGDLTDSALRAIAPYGRLVIAGYASGTIPYVKGNLALLKQAIVVGASYRSFVERQPGAARANMNLLCEWLEQGKLKPEVGRIL